MSTQFKHILVPYDNSASAEKALNKAISLSKVFSARITVAYVENSKSKKDSAEKVRKLTEELEQKTGIEFFFIHPKGKVFKEIVRSAEDVEADLIIMGTHGTSGFEEFWIGSVAFRVVSSASVPVITIQETYTKSEFKKIVLPIDHSVETRQKIPMAITMAKYFDAEVHLFLTSKFTADEMITKVVQYGKQCKKMLREAGINCIAESKFGGNIAESTINYAKANDADLIVMMAESEPSTGLFMGSNAQRLVNHSPIPVLTIHAKNLKKIGAVGY